jgi:cyclic dehypoxanthinyl futalosine synthase
MSSANTIAATVSLSSIEQKLMNKQRVDLDELRFLWHNTSDEDLQRLSSIVRDRYHKPKHSIYQIMRIVNYTNICVAKCDYCAFYRLPNSPEGYLRSKDYVFGKIQELIDVGGEMFGFNGGFNPALKIDYYEDLFGSIKERFGDNIEMYAMTVVELIYMARLSGLSLVEALKRLKAVGVRWIPGGGAEILADTFRKRHSPTKYTVAEYFDAQKEILKAGMKTTATMVIGFDESFEERLEHLEGVRNFQDSTDGGLFSFLCWTYKPYNNELGGNEITIQEYLRHLALCRIYLDNIPHLKLSTLTAGVEGLKGMNYGANYFDIPWEDEVTQSAGATIDQDVEKMLSSVHELGFEVQRYRITADA